MESEKGLQMSKNLTSTKTLPEGAQIMQRGVAAPSRVLAEQFARRGASASLVQAIGDLSPAELAVLLERVDATETPS
jgi:hypothetical protein